ncbi:hypothetical protein GGR51DRAFT_562582 [Nemania sp. FL0031]|nr:hypothetical protein GGR51DRAFT_562582 [Nemania sp. FL0031]
MRLSISLAVFALDSLSTSSALSLKLEDRQAYPQKTVKVTFYGYPDTHDSSCSAAYVGHNCNNPDGTPRNWLAGGDGSWNNPLTMMGDFEPCSIVYLPYLRKYGIIDDTCPPCAKNILDVWVESSCYDDPNKVIQCEYAMTPGTDQPVLYGITSGQSSSLPLAVGHLFDSATQTCPHQTF